jgi:Mce-associated membrane protein
MAVNADTAGEMTLLLDDEVADIEDYDGECDAHDSAAAPDPPADKPKSAVRRTALLTLAVAVALAVLVGWLGFRTYQSNQANAQRSQFLQVARQGALNLTTIDWQKADGDVQRIVDGATGQFHDDFASRAKSFVEVVKQAKSTTVGTITDAGLESQNGDAAQALVAVTVTTSDAGAPQPIPHSWRMRISVQKVGDQVKVSNVEFVA